MTAPALPCHLFGVGVYLAGRPWVELHHVEASAAVLLTVAQARQTADALVDAVHADGVTWTPVGPVATLAPAGDLPVLSVWSVGTGTVRLVVEHWKYPAGWTLPAGVACALADVVDRVAALCELIP